MLSLILLLLSIIAGVLGTLLGLGGGIIVVPALTLLFNVDIRYAVAASLVSIIATSSSGAAILLKKNLTNVRVATVLELGTVTGALTGFFISTHINAKWLFLIFGLFLFLCSFLIFKKREDHISEDDHPWSKKLKLRSYFLDDKGQKVNYQIENIPLGMISMYFAGILSAILGIGSGIFKVIAMDNSMKLPIKVSTATSNFMIGVTAAASAGAYFIRGDIRTELASPVALGIIIGSWLGTKLLTKLSATLLRKIFVFVLFIVSIQMIMKGFTL